MKKKKQTRREFLKDLGIASGIGLFGLPIIATSNLGSLLDLTNPAYGDKKRDSADELRRTIAVVSGRNPAEMTALAIKTLGGISRFVKKGNVVVVKPNIAWARTPEQAANTNPEVVATIVKECLKAGARKVQVLDNPCNDARQTYRISGIQKAAQQAGAEVILLSKRKVFFRETDFPKGKVLKSWPIVKEVLDCDVLINVPIAKHHNLTRLTLGIKNLMGVMGDKRGKIHDRIAEKLVDLLTRIKPQLTIIDAYRVLVAHGPTGGNLKDVRLAGKIIAGIDPVAVDAYASALPEFGLSGKKINYIKEAYKRGLGEIDLSRMKIIEKKL